MLHLHAVFQRTVVRTRNCVVVSQQAGGAKVRALVLSERRTSRDGVSAEMYARVRDENIRCLLFRQARKIPVGAM